MTSTFRLLSSAAALGLGMLAPSILVNPAAIAEPAAGASGGIAGSPGEEGGGASVCRLLSISNPISLECSAGPSGSSADGASSASVEDGDAYEDD
ncbi:hypothetical protein ABT324_21965 [Saccharopolyspora sp. NPDC000359]|uniref:hypothetical protein n=1 Tax=Saccharopolyspora sp. NPDC000359 TaxID=3154251 RepID=UPI0033214102